MNVERLWEMYEESSTKEFFLKQAEEKDKNYLTLVEGIAQNGISNGILRCLEELEEDKNKTFKRAFNIYKKVRGLRMTDEIKTICKCEKGIEDVYNPQENFEYAGCNEENNPYFKCKDCEVFVYG